MWATKGFERHCMRFTSALNNRNLLRDASELRVNPFHRLRWASEEFGQWGSSSSTFSSSSSTSCSYSSASCKNSMNGFSMGFSHVVSRSMSTKGRSMRSKVEKRMRRETGKTLREIRRAKKLRKKLMSDEERLIYSLRRAKKKVALLLQKLKKYELPELPAPRHDPELLTPEQLQAYKKIGFKNKNYVPVGVRGVFGGVVQNMHLHWKFHETVQVCCDNFPKEKIKEMATMLARLSGGIVINIHGVKTIIMFRGRNYRQPKNLIPINTLTKRKALFKARFEQALDSQKQNIKKIEQQLRRMGMNPEDPIAMASVQRVASTFFRAIDDKQGTPYVFHGDNQTSPKPMAESPEASEDPLPSDEDSDQEELDRFIAEIEEAADQEWEKEEAADKEEIGRIRYWNREQMGGREGSEDSDDDGGGHGMRNWHDSQDRGRRTTDLRRWDGRKDRVAEVSPRDRWDSGDSESEDELGLMDDGMDNDSDASDDVGPSRSMIKVPKDHKLENRGVHERGGGARFRQKVIVEDDDDGNDGDDDGGFVGNKQGNDQKFWESEGEEEEDLRLPGYDSCSSSGEELEYNMVKEERVERDDNRGKGGKHNMTLKQVDEDWDSD
ncbi:hypothetical protein AMTRI_Chr06g176620 [Amborella trichopoda]